VNNSQKFLKVESYLLPHEVSHIEPCDGTDEWYHVHANVRFDNIHGLVRTEALAEILFAEDSYIVNNENFTRIPHD